MPLKTPKKTRPASPKSRAGQPHLGHDRLIRQQPHRLVTLVSCCRVVARVKHSCAPYDKGGCISHAGLSCPLQMRLAVSAAAAVGNVGGLCSTLAVPALRLLNTRPLGVEHSAMT